MSVLVMATIMIEIILKLRPTYDNDGHYDKERPARLEVRRMTASVRLLLGHRCIPESRRLGQ